MFNSDLINDIFFFFCFSPVEGEAVNQNRVGLDVKSGRQQWKSEHLIFVNYNVLKVASSYVCKVTNC